MYKDIDVDIYRYTYINFKAINNVLDAKMVLKIHLLIKIFRLLYRSFVFMYVSMYIFIFKYKRSKTRVFSFFSHSLLHIDTQALTSHVGKMLHSIW